MSAPALSTPLPRRHARLGRYAEWQARDFVINIAIITLLLFGMLGWLIHLNMDANEEMMRARHMTMTTPMRLGLFRELFAMFTYVAPIIAVSGIFSVDRSSGYTRFLFAKPVSPPRFYAQSLIVKFAGFLVVSAVLLFVWSRLHPPAFDWKILAAAAIGFVVVGGIVFLTSVLTRFDGLIGIVVLLVGAVVWDKWEHVTGFKHWLTWIAPPTSKLTELHDWALGLNAMGNLVDLPFPTKWAMWNVAYGVACVLLGLVMLRKVPVTKA
ncbi:MAG TPA: hypothetical protein VN706_02260 [Gemmatimonadaceae bacterium]|nr:hypothetical protein [Gemmatimonadaceae bacterium]